MPTQLLSRSSATILSPSNFFLSFGGFLVCTCIGCMLSGLTWHQTYRYFRLYPTDGSGLKSLVVLLFLMDIIHTITSIHACYYYLVRNWGLPFSLLDGVWSVRVEILETAVMILIAHCFYARRLYLLGNSNMIPVVIIMVLLVVEMGFSIAATIESFLQVSFPRFYIYQWTIWGVLGSALAVDVLATSILTWYLRKNRTGFNFTNSIVDVMMIYTINTGLSTSIITFAALICSIALPHSLLYAALTVIGTKMYANSLLAVLNSRRSLVDRGAEALETGSFGLQVFNPRNVGSPPTLDYVPKRAPVTKETFTDSAMKRDSASVGQAEEDRDGSERA